MRLKTNFYGTMYHKQKMYRIFIMIVVDFGMLIHLMALHFKFSPTKLNTECPQKCSMLQLIPLAIFGTPCSRLSFVVESGA